MKGILSKVNEEVRLPKGSVKDLMFKLSTEQKNNSYFSMFSTLYLLITIEYNPAKSNQFGIAHYAGSVIYTTDAWLDKNR